RERTAIACGDTKTLRAFSRRGGARRKLERHEIEIAQEEPDEQPDRADEFRAAEIRGNACADGEQRHGDQNARHDRHIQQERGGALAHIGENKPQIDAFRGYEVALTTVQDARDGHGSRTPYGRTAVEIGSPDDGGRPGDAIAPGRARDELTPKSF